MKTIEEVLIYRVLIFRHPNSIFYRDLRIKLFETFRQIILPFIPPMV